MSDVKQTQTMTEFFIRRPIFSMVISILIVLLGVLSIFGLPIEQYPDISAPNVQVTTVYQGADATAVDQAVATPLGRAIMGASDMIYIKSTSANDGTMRIQATFDVGSDHDMDAVFTQNNASTATSLLPASVIQYGVTTKKASTDFLVIFSLYSDDGRYDGKFLSNYAYINIQNELLKIHGVGEVDILGAGQYSMRIWVKPDVLGYLNIALSDITSAISAQSGVFPAGQLGGEPSAEGTQFTYTVTMPPQITKPEEYGNIVIRTMPDGSQVRLKDVATIELGTQTYGVKSNFEGHPSTMINVFQEPGSNALEVGNAVKAKMEELSARFYDGMKYTTVVDATTSIVSGMDDIIVTLLIALVLVILIIYLFMQDLRAMVIPLVAIPVSLVGAFMLFPLLGFTINVFSLLGIVLAIGLVVDDAIVVVEAVQVGMEKGLDVRQATIRAMRAVSSPIIATTVVLAAVFIPVSFVGGITGKLYQQFSITIVLSMVISAFNALTLSPTLCVLLLRHKERATHGFFGWFNRWFGRRTDQYVGFAGTVARHGGRTLLFIAVVGASIFLISRTIPAGFVPQEDKGYLMVNYKLPNASALSRTDAVGRRVETMIKQIPEVEHVSSVSGYNMLSRIASTNSGITFVTLKPYADRRRTANEVQDQINKMLYLAVNEAQCFAFQPPAIQGMGTASGISMMMQDLSGQGVTYPGSYLREFLDSAQTLPEISNITSQFDAQVPQRQLVIDNDLAFQQGVSLAEIHSVLTTYLGGAYINNFNRFGSIYRTYVQSEPQYRQSKDNLMEFFVTNRDGQKIPLANFVSVKDTVGIEFALQFNLYPSIPINAIADNRYSSIEAMDALETLAGRMLPQDIGVAWADMSYQERNASSTGSTALLIALVFVFLILAALYESWSLPLSILLGVPFALFGAMAVVAVVHLIDPLIVSDIFMQVSLILLIALSAKNAILIVEYANDMFFNSGRTAREAATEAARLRFRPILMTAFAFLLGIAPLTMASGASSIARQVMGFSLLGGMGIATIIGVFVYPALYVLIARLGHFDCIRERRRKHDAEIAAASAAASATEPTTSESASAATPPAPAADQETHENPTDSTL